MAATKADFLQAMAVGKLASSAVMERIHEFPDGSLLKIKEQLEVELPAAARSTKLGIDAKSIQDMIQYAEGYQGFACFPETTVRVAVKTALCGLRQPIHSVLNCTRNLVAQDVRKAIEGSQEEILARVKNGRYLEEIVCAESNAIVCQWFEDAVRMVDSLLSMEHEMPDIQMLGRLFREAGVGIEETHEKEDTAMLDPQRRFVMGHLMKKNVTTGIWSQRWCVVQPGGQKLFVHKDASKDPVYEIDLTKTELVGHEYDGRDLGEERSFLLKSLDTPDSTNPKTKKAKKRNNLRLKAPNSHVKELWVNALEPLCGNAQSLNCETDSMELETSTDDSHTTVSSEEAENTDPTRQLAPVDTSSSGHCLHNVEANADMFSLAVSNYVDIVREQLILSIPKALVYLFVDKLTGSFSDTLVQRLIEAA